MQILSVAQSAGRWFLESGIQEANGGVARYYRRDTQQNVPVSNEITGYAVSTLVYLHSITGEQNYVEKALAAARYLADTAWDQGEQTFPFECGIGTDPLAYFFDCGIIARGLLAIWRVTRERRFLELAAACGRSMAMDFASADSDFHPVIRLPGKAPLARDDRWSRSPGCYQLKSGLAWHELAQETGDATFQQHYERLLSCALRTCAGFLPGHPDPHRVMDRLHAYCYFLEGLLPCADRQRCGAALCDGLRRVAGYLRGIAPDFVRSDVYAQLLRLRLFAAWAGAAPLDREAAEEEAARLAEFQLDHPDPRLRGGFCFGRQGTQLLPYVNPVSAAFGLQALEMWRRYALDEPQSRHGLI